MTLLRVFILALFLFQFFVIEKAGAAPFHIDRGLWGEVLVTDRVAKGLVRVPREEALGRSAVYFQINGRRKGFRLGAKFTDDVYVFLNGTLQTKLSAGDWYMSDEYLSDQLLGFYSPVGDFSVGDSVVMFNTDISEPAQGDEIGAGALPVRLEKGNDESKLIFLGFLIFAMQVLVHTLAPGYFRRVFDWQKAIVNAEFDNETGQIPFNREHLVILASTVLNIALLFTLLGRSKLMTLIPGQFSQSMALASNDMIFEFCVIAILATASLLVKYLFSLTFTAVIGTSKLANAHFSHFLKMLFVFSTLLADLTFILVFSDMGDAPFLSEFLILGMKALVLLLVANVILFIYKWTGVRDNLLISYLCATEILPVFLLFVYY